MTDSNDRALVDLVARDPARGWQLFIERYTPLILGRLDRAGVRDHDEKMDVYTLVCERLVADGCARLRAWRADAGPLGAWLSVVVRNVTVDWVRSRAGRRRVFAAVQALAPLDRQVFELFYWEERRVPEIAGLLSTRLDRAICEGDVLESLGRINQAMTERQRSDLLSTAFRSRAMESLDGPDGAPRVDPADDAGSVEGRLIVEERRARLASAIGALPHEDAAILRLHLENGLTLAQVRRALRLDVLSIDRVERIVADIKGHLA